MTLYPFLLTPFPAKMKPGQDVVADVNPEDQKNLNAFGRLNKKLNTLRDELTLKKVSPPFPLLLLASYNPFANQTEKEAVHDASNDLLLADDESVLYTMGDGFVRMTKDALEARLTVEEEKLDKGIARLTDDIDGVKAEMAKLKSILYAKFGSSINLEE